MKRLLVSIGFAFLISNSIILFITFLLAYFNNFEILININNYGEANFELALIPATIILGIYAIYETRAKRLRILKRYRK